MRGPCMGRRDWPLAAETSPHAGDAGLCRRAPDLQQSTCDDPPTERWPGRHPASRLYARELTVSARGRPNEEHRRGNTENPSDGMKMPPGFQELQRLIRSTIATRIEQPVIRWANREQRKRNHRKDE